MAKIQLGLAPVNVKLRVKLLNSSVTTGAGLTGLTNASSGLIISTIQVVEGANGEATPTIYAVGSSNVETIAALGTFAAPTAGKCRFKEVDATNHPGIYELQIADARYSASGDATKPMTLLISLSGATNLAQADIEVECRNQAVNVIQIGGTAQTARDVGASVLLSPGTGAGQLDITSGVVKSNATQLAGQAVTAAAGVTFPTSVASPTNITAGTITTVTNLTNAPTVGDFTAAMKSSLSTTAYPEGFIHYNSAASNTNTVIGVDGTPANPVSTPAAAKTLADALGTKMIHVQGTWTNIVTMAGYYFIGVSHDDIINFNGTDMSNCYFENIDLRGVNTGSTNLYNKVSTINTYTVAGVAFDSEVGNTVSITGYSNLFNCQPTGNGAMTLVFGSIVQNVNINGLIADSILITGITADSTISIVFAGNPIVTIDASCTKGTVNIMGYIQSLIDNSTGSCVVNDRRNLTSITADVWDAARSGHSIAGTFGEYANADTVKINGSAPAAVQLAKSANTIVDGVVDTAYFVPTITEFETTSLPLTATDFYKTRTMIFTSGTLDNQARTIVASSCNGGTGTTHFTVESLTSAPAAGVGFNIV